ncbi:hypothetical protein [uncultured Pedobacter sp.]|nr:hypothetical protein [uncultured Pedobacter sp.]
MRKILLLLAVAVIISSSCKKTANDGQGEVYVKWKLTETLFDIGNGQGK